MKNGLFVVAFFCYKDLVLINFKYFYRQYCKNVHSKFHTIQKFTLQNDVNIIYSRLGNYHIFDSLKTAYFINYQNVLFRINIVIIIV